MNRRGPVVQQGVKEREGEANSTGKHWGKRGILVTTSFGGRSLTNSWTFVHLRLDGIDPILRLRESKTEL